MIIDTNNLTEESFAKLKTIVRVAGEHYWGSPATKDNKLNESVAKGLNFTGYNALSAKIEKKAPSLDIDSPDYSASTEFVRIAAAKEQCPHCNVELDVEQIDDHSSKMSCDECEMTLFVTNEGDKQHVLIAWAPNELDSKEEHRWITRNTKDDEQGTVSWVHEPAYSHPWFISFTENLVASGKPIFLPDGELNPDEMVRDVIEREQNIDTPEQIAELKVMYEEQEMVYVYACPDSGVTMHSNKAPTEDDVSFSTVVTIDCFDSVKDPRPVARPLFGWAMTECGLHDPK